ncbi:hypothetical protein [Amycolatopsis anabasis]|uniref:hypothetical protein n=1 Tax=Amycolatopsis anabasis TaxID=1840409 RepID=UPI00131DA509|nr:hypothetical protein [Amycolatopsis anabasis]
MRQLSFFSAEARSPEVADLAGVLCGPGRIVGFGRTAARLSVEVREPWRARLLVGEFARCGVRAEVVRPEKSEDEDENEEGLVVRTAFRADLIALAAAWRCGGENGVDKARGAGKAVPCRFRLDGGVLRSWVLTGGRRMGAGYLLALDERAPETHVPLAEAIGSIGLGGTRLGPRGGGPAIRVSGRRRLATLAELIGEPPAGAELAWPESGPARRAG